MKLKRYIDSILESHEDNFFHHDDYYRRDEEDNNNEDDEDDLDQPDIDILNDLIDTVREMTERSIPQESDVYLDDENRISIQFLIDKNEKLSIVMNIMNFLNKLSNDIFEGYDAEFDLWETKQGTPLMTVSFSYGESKSRKFNIKDFKL